MPVEFQNIIADKIQESDILLARKTLIDLRFGSNFICNSDGHLLYLNDLSGNKKWFFSLDDLNVAKK